MVGMVQADGGELRNAGDRRSRSAVPSTAGSLDGIERSELGSAGRRIGLAVEVPIAPKIAQLAGFIDQAGLFRALGRRSGQASFCHSLRVLWS